MIITNAECERCGSCAEGVLVELANGEVFLCFHCLTEILDELSELSGYDQSVRITIDVHHEEEEEYR